MKPRKDFHFENEQVEVRIPEQVRKIKAVSLPTAALESMPGKPGGFKPGRVVMNVALVDEDLPQEYLSQFDEPFELRVRYTPADLKRAQNAGRPLQLAFWDGTEWVVFTPEKHQFALAPDKQGGGGYGVVQLSRWGDPNIAWGP